MKKFAFMRSIFLPLFMTSFFLFMGRANASTYNHDFSSVASTSYDIFKTDNFIQVRQNLINSHNPFIIYYRNSRYWVLSLSDLSNFSCVNNTCTSTTSSTNYTALAYDSTFSSVVATTKYTNTEFKRIYFSNAEYIIDTNLKLFGVSTHTYNVSDGIYDYSCTNSTSIPCELPTLYSIYVDHYLNNDTPILDSFYSVVLDKISLLTSSFINNYIYVALFGVFILIFLIELIRRYFL